MTIYFVLVITLRQLVSELEEGIRLPSPENCPSSIARLIQQCFAANPTERPSFGDIMKVIETDYVTLRRAPTSSAKIEPNEKEQLTYADIEFEKRYLDMRIKNRNQQEGQRNNFEIEETVVIDGVSLTASFRNETPRYLSLHDVRSSANPLPTVIIDSQRTSSTKQRECIKDEGMTRNPKHALSPGSNGHKRSFSYGGEDRTPTLQPKRLISNPLMPAQSYPNPTYMIFPSILNSNETVDDTILNMAKTWHDDTKSKHEINDEEMIHF